MSPALRTSPTDDVYLQSRRSPYWVRGMGRAEPWVALAQTNIGHVIVPCGHSEDRARAVVAAWQKATAARKPDDEGRWIVGAVVVDPRGDTPAGWKLSGPMGTEPVVGGPSRWAPLLRISEPTVCGECHQERWPGCWMALDFQGCTQCMPALESDDPRVWPLDPAKPAPARIVSRERTPKTTRRKSRAIRPMETVSPAQSRL